MQVLSVILVLITIGTIVAPIGAVVVMYHDDLAGLVITPQIKDLMNGDGILANGNAVSDNTQNDNSVGVGLVMPTFVSSSVNSVDRTFQVVVNVTDPLNEDLTINSIKADVDCSEDHYQLGSISLASPVTIPSGQSSLLTVSGSWSLSAEEHIQSSHSDQTAISVDLINTSIDINGIVAQYSSPITIPDGIPIT